jgi:hypothetical protein
VTRKFPMKDEEVAETRNNESCIVCPGKDYSVSGGLFQVTNLALGPGNSGATLPF